MEMAEAAAGMPSHDGGNIHMEESRKEGSSQLSYVGGRLVVYGGFSASSTMKFPIFRCHNCVDSEMLALFSGCPPLSPIKPKMWVDVWLCQLYHHLFLTAGVSSTNFCKSVDLTHSSFFDMCDGDIKYHSLDDSSFSMRHNRCPGF